MARNLVKVSPTLWTSKPETYPVVAAVAAALGFLGWSSARHLSLSPDTHFAKGERCVGPYDRSGQQQEGQVWADTMKTKSRWNRPGLDVGEVSIFEAWFKPEKAAGLAAVHGPTPPATR
jgi:hypothetical protein